MKLNVIKNKKAYLRRRKLRRFLTLIAIMTIFAYATHLTYTTRMNRLEQLQAELEMYNEEYEQVMLRQGFYLNQVLRLEDEDYIAMLARQRYFRTLEHELVFRILDESIDTLDATDEHY